MITPFLSWHRRRNDALVWLVLFGSFLRSAKAETSIDITFRDKSSGEKISSRIEFTKPASKAPRPKNSLSAGRQLLVEGTAHFTPPPGDYEFFVHRGPEFSVIRAGFELEKNVQNAIDVVVPQKTSMRKWGWYSGDLESPMQPDLLRRWMLADDLDVVASTSNLAIAVKKSDSPNISFNRKQGTASDRFDPIENRKSNTRDDSIPPSMRHVQTQSQHFKEPGQGGLLIHPLTENTFEASTNSSFATIDRINAQSPAFVEITKPWERDVPILLTTGRIDSVQLLSNYLQPDSSDSIHSSIRNPDPLRFKGKKALGRLSEFIYWKMLDAGFRLPPTAGSGFDGKLPTHLGYNRVYTWLAPEMPHTIDTWWSQLRAGHSMVTNGPLIHAMINGLPPGTIYPSYREQPVPLDIGLELTVRDPVEYLDVVFNGKAIYQARLEDHAKRGQFPPLNIVESGWLVLRVVTEHENSYRMATTAPFYFEVDGKQRVSRSAVQFFQDWLDESQSLVEQNDEWKAIYQEPIAKAKRFWFVRALQANVE